MRVAIDGRASVSLKLMLRFLPAALMTRVSIVRVGSEEPSSIREMVEVGTPTLVARARRDRPACSRARLTRAGIALTKYGNCDTYVAKLCPAKPHLLPTPPTASPRTASSPSR